MRLLTGTHRREWEESLLLFGQTSGEHAQMVLRVDQLEAEVKEWKAQAAADRLRADRAVDALLSVRGFPMVTPPEAMPERADALAEDPETVAAVEARIARGDLSVFAEYY